MTETWEQLLTRLDLMVAENDFLDALEAERTCYRRMLEEGEVMLEVYNQWGVLRRVSYSQLRREGWRLEELFRRIGLKPVIHDWEEAAQKIIAKRARPQLIKPQRRGIEL